MTISLRRQMARKAFLIPAIILLLASWPVSSNGADLPLHARIDAIISASLDGPPVPIADDAEFLRRVSLDLTGGIPSPAVARRFLDDPSPDKRTQLIDRLLESRKYERWMPTLFDVMLMERRPDKHVPSEQWREFLRRSFAENKPYDQLVREILSADGTDKESRPAAKFFLDRDVETPLLTRDVGRILFGMDLQCAQCHDHPVIADYAQADYFGLNAFLSRSSLHEFKDFDYEAKNGTVTFPPGATEQIIVIGIKGDELDEPDETILVTLSNAHGVVVTDAQGIGTILDDDGEVLPAENSDVSQANQQTPAALLDENDSRPRLSINDWKLKEKDGGTDWLPFTLTLSKPSSLPVTVDFATSDGTARNGGDKPVTIAETATGEVTFKSVFAPETSETAVPRLPDGLTIEEPTFAEGEEYLVKPGGGERSVPRFSLRQALAELATGGRSSAFNRNIANRLWATMMGRGLVHPVDLNHAENPPSHPELLDILADEFVQTGFDVKNFLRELALSETYQRSTRQPAATDRQNEAPQLYAVGLLKPLSGEQLAYSVLTATGATAFSRTAAEERVKADPKYLALDDSAAEQKQLLAKMVDQAMQRDLQDEVNDFVAVFAESGSQGFQATARQALFLSNDDLIQRLLEPGQGKLADRLLRIDDSTQLAEELYLSILTRRPSTEEAVQVDSYLEQSQAGREAAVQELVWALLTSLEFRFNH
jgi:hypothetical protein